MKNEIIIGTFRVPLGKRWDHLKVMQGLEAIPLYLILMLYFYRDTSKVSEMWSGLFQSVKTTVKRGGHETRAGDDNSIHDAVIDANAPATGNDSLHGKKCSS